MSDRDTIEKLIREAYRRRVADDTHGLCDMFSDDTEYRMIKAVPPDAPAFVARRQPDLRAVMAQLVQNFQLKDFSIKTLLIDGNKVAVHWNSRVVSTINGHVSETDVLDLIEVRDGKIASLTEFCDTALVERMMTV